MTYNVFGGTLSLTQSINQPPPYEILDMPTPLKQNDVMTN